MYITWEKRRAGLIGMLIGDASGVPYEFKHSCEIPTWDKIDMQPPKGYIRTYAHIPVGTWSDDGAQGLCLLHNLIDNKGLDLEDLGKRLLAWRDEGYMSINNFTFDIGNQTSEALMFLRNGTPADQSGLTGERNNGNGSLMRVLPLALFHTGSDRELVIDAHNQSRVTHAHPRSLVCCALYCLWARNEMRYTPDPWNDSIRTLRSIYAKGSRYLKELDEKVLISQQPQCAGSGYVVDCLLSARIACNEKSFENIIKRAISYGNDTDTTACVAGGIAGIRHGEYSIPERWIHTLKGKNILQETLEKWEKYTKEPSKNEEPVKKKVIQISAQKIQSKMAV